MSENDKTNKTAHADGKDNADKKAAPVGKDKKNLPKEEELVLIHNVTKPSLVRRRSSLERETRPTI